jgi:hypothetical protein
MPAAITPAMNRKADTTMRAARNHPYVFRRRLKCSRLSIFFGSNWFAHAIHKAIWNHQPRRPSATAAAMQPNPPKNTHGVRPRIPSLSLGNVAKNATPAPDSPTTVFSKSRAVRRARSHMFGVVRSVLGSSLLPMAGEYIEIRCSLHLFSAWFQNCHSHSKKGEFWAIRRSAEGASLRVTNVCSEMKLSRGRRSMGGPIYEANYDSDDSPFDEVGYC